jgi:hypothetical protein
LCFKYVFLGVGFLVGLGVGGFVCRAVFFFIAG